MESRTTVRWAKAGDERILACRCGTCRPSDSGSRTTSPLGFLFSMADDIRTTGGVAAQLVVRTSLDDRLFAAPVHFEHLFF